MDIVDYFAFAFAALMIYWKLDDILKELKQKKRNPA